MKYFDIYNSLRDNHFSFQGTAKSYNHLLIFFELSFDQNNHNVGRPTLMNILAHFKLRWNIFKRTESYFVKNNPKWLDKEINLINFNADKTTIPRTSSLSSSSTG